MHLLLVSATDFEISETALWLNNPAISHNAPKPELLISGIGQLQTAFAIQKKIQLQRPSLVIQAGIGGGPSKEDTGKVYAIRSEKMGDLGLMEKAGFTNIFDMGLDRPDRFPFRDGKLINPYRFLLEWTGLPVLDGITVNEIKSADFAGFQRNAAPVVESMEGAALHYVCLMEKIPFLQIRSVSNVMGDRDKSRWKLKESRENLHESLVFLIQKLENADETLFRI
ncbi:MAG TPA: futalosine hydrolase [Puia sp.]